MGLLSVLIWLPVAGGLLVMAVGSNARWRPDRWLALLVAVLTFALSVPLYMAFDSSTANMQFIERLPWIPLFNIEYYLGIDGFSAPLILLTTFLTPLVLLAGWDVIKQKPHQYLAAFLLLEGFMIGVFAALDAMLFYVFWEIMLIPMFIIIGVWGGPRRIYATLKFFLFTFFGSVLMLVALIYLYVQGGSFSVLDMHYMPLGATPQWYLFIAFLVAFAVKIPMWPVHTWLPDAHVEAPTGGSIVLAAVLLKMGGYGFLRFALPIAPDAAQTLSGMMIVLSLIAVIYIGFVALVQTDMKKLIAYSSIAHMGFVTLGLFIPWQILSNSGSSDGVVMGLTGAMVQMISHGLISAAMFMCVGVMYDRLHSREISAYGGVVNTMPVFAAFMVLFALANSGVPGTSGFVGEFLVILASFKASFWIAFLAATTLILGAAYTLWMVKRVVFGAVSNVAVAGLSDVTSREVIILATLALAVLLLGLWPAPLVEMIETTATGLMTHVLESKL